MKTVFVVSDKFGDFAKHENVMTFAEFGHLARTGGLDRLPPGTLVVAGQGLSEAQALELRETTARARNAATGEVVQCLTRGRVRAGRLQSHKSRIENTIISSPVRCGEDSFEAELLLDERCELMRDHQTGQHLQGMVLVEATRQMFLAVTEAFFIGLDDHTRYYFVINGIDVSFQGFVFPVDASLHYEILEKRTEDRSRMYFKVSVEVHQAGKCATRVGYEFTAFLASRIEEKENQQAEKVLATVDEWMDVRAVGSRAGAGAKRSLEAAEATP